jgi:hypothetical protein
MLGTDIYITGTCYECHNVIYLKRFHHNQYRSDISQDLIQTILCILNLGLKLEIFHGEPVVMVRQHQQWCSFLEPRS